MPDVRDVLTLAEAAQDLGLSVWTLRVQVREYAKNPERGLRAAKLGHVYYVTRADLAAYKRRSEQWHEAGSKRRKAWGRAQRVNG